METASFTAAGRTWLFDLNLLQIRKIQTATGGFLLPRLVDINSAEYQRLGSDSELLCTVLGILLEGQLQSASLSLDGLLGQMDGQQVSAAIVALVEAVANFSQSRTAAATVRLIRQGMELISRMDQTLGQAMEGLGSSGGLFGSAAESPGSSRGDTRSEISSSMPTLQPGGNLWPPVEWELPPVPVEESASTP